MAAKIWFIVLGLVVTTSAKSFTNVSAFPESLYGSNLTDFRKECPDQLGKMDSCIALYKECVGLMRITKECNQEFCGCVGNNGYNRDDSIPQKCMDHLDRACVAVHSKGSLFKNQIIEENTKPAKKKIEISLNQIRSAHENVVQQCGIESKMRDEEARMLASINSSDKLLSLTMTFFAMANVEKFIVKSDECQKSIDLYERVLQNLDKETVDHLEIPYRFWFIGAEFGSIGRVVTRALAVKTCGNASPELNHHSVVRVNCYDRKMDRKECDEKYLKATKHTLSTMESKKLKCKMFTDFIEQIQSLRAVEFYKEAADYHGTGLKIDVNGDFKQNFEGFYKGSMSKRETTNDIVRLEGSQNSPLRLQPYLEKVSIDCGNSKNSADVVTSCAFKYAYCIHKIKSECMIQLSICLDHIDGMDKPCEDSIKEISNILWPSTETKPIPTSETKAETGNTKALSRETKKVSSWWTGKLFISIGSIGVITLLIFIIGATICQQGGVTGVKRICSEKHSMKQEKQEGMRLVETPSSSSSEAGTVTEGDVVPSRNDEASDQDSLYDPEEISPMGNNDNYETIKTESPGNNQEDPQPDGMKTETDSIHEHVDPSRN